MSRMRAATSLGNPRLLLLVVALAASLAGGACRGDGTASDKRPTPTFRPNAYMSHLQNEGKVVVGVSGDVPQFGFENLVTRRLEGFEVDFAHLIAKKLGISVELVKVEPHDRVDALIHDRVDLVIAGLVISPELADQIELSAGYYPATHRLLVRKDRSHLFRDPAAIGARQGTVCTVEGSSAERNIKAAAPGAIVVARERVESCFQLLSASQVDVVTAGERLLLGLLKLNQRELTFAEGTIGDESYAMGMKKGRPGWRPFIDGVIADAKRDGTWVRLHSKWIRPITGQEAHIDDW